MIPKKIHYCWFSGKKIPREFEYYIESWKKYCPDYEIIRWDESNYDIHKNVYMESAYKEQRWGFVPDYARFDIIYREGGIYLDTDVELIKPLDPLLENACFLGFEDERHIAPGLGFGAEAGNPVIKELRDMYDQKNFYHKDGSINLTPSPEYVTQKLKSMGIKINNQTQKMAGITVYPREYFGAKDYNTGEIHRTDHTYSIHHYSCTWMTREERKEEERRRAFCGKYGNYWGNRVDGLYKRIESCQKKHKKNELSFKNRVKEHYFYSEEKNWQRLMHMKTADPLMKKLPIQKVTLLSPAIKTENIGDRIIEMACMNHLPIGNDARFEKITTHDHPSRKEIRWMGDSDVVIITGSNLLCADMNHGQWKLPADYSALSQICLMGCGWSTYGEGNEFSNAFYRAVLNNGWSHSVRDRYTLSQLKAAGVENVLYTGCPTMWNLTEEHCRSVPVKKAHAVVTALTSYQADYDNDSYQMNLMFEHYDKVYFWPQGTEDERYLRQILTESEKKRVVILDRDLETLKSVLKNEQVDYVGNRLHAGILALNTCCRSKIIGIDNRALEISKDTGLPVIPREKVKDELEAWIYDEEPVHIQMPWDNIKRWKQQFVDE